MAQSVLVIDDSHDVHRLLDARLRPEGLIVHHAFDAEDGLAKARHLQPDLILLDITMPDTTGFQVCQQLKADPGTADLPVIFLSAAEAAYAKVQGLDLGAVDFVTKPFEVAELKARVRAALRTKRCHDLLASRAQIDALTGLWNRAYFNQRLSDELAAARRYRRSVSLVMMDLDHFKQMNDLYGHPFGDRVLQSVGEVLTATLRSTDAPCRYGGEEFGLILAETDAKGAEFTVRRVQDQLAAIDLNLVDRVPVTASFGLAAHEHLAGEQLTVDALVAAADDALYAAKRAGRNRLVVAEAPRRPRPAAVPARAAFPPSD